MIEMIFGWAYALADRLYDGVSGIKSRAWQEMTWVGDARLCGFGTFGVIELRTPMGNAKHKVLRAESLAGFRELAHILRVEGWKAWARSAPTVELVAANRRAGDLRLRFPKSRGVQEDLDILVGIILAEQRRRSEGDRGYGPIFEATAING